MVLSTCQTFQIVCVVGGEWEEAGLNNKEEVKVMMREKNLSRFDAFNSFIKGPWTSIKDTTASKFLVLRALGFDFLPLERGGGAR